MSPEDQERFDRAARQLDEDLAKEKADAMPERVTDGAYMSPGISYSQIHEMRLAHLFLTRKKISQYYDRDLPDGCYTPEQARAAMQASQKRP